MVPMVELEVRDGLTDSNGEGGGDGENMRVVVRVRDGLTDSNGEGGGDGENMRVVVRANGAVNVVNVTNVLLEVEMELEAGRLSFSFSSFPGVDIDSHGTKEDERGSVDALAMGRNAEYECAEVVDLSGEMRETNEGAVDGVDRMSSFIAYMLSDREGHVNEDDGSDGEEWSGDEDSSYSNEDEGSDSEEWSGDEDSSYSDEDEGSDSEEWSGDGHCSCSDGHDYEGCSSSDDCEDDEVQIIEVIDLTVEEDAGNDDSWMDENVVGELLQMVEADDAPNVGPNVDSMGIEAKVVGVADEEEHGMEGDVVWGGDASPRDIEAIERMLKDGSGVFGHFGCKLELGESLLQGAGMGVFVKNDCAIYHGDCITEYSGRILKSAKYLSGEDQLRTIEVVGTNGQSLIVLGEKRLRYGDGFGSFLNSTVSGRTLSFCRFVRHHGRVFAMAFCDKEQYPLRGRIELYLTAGQGWWSLFNRMK